jgi:cholesterol transport system auxiliary component
MLSSALRSRRFFLAGASALSLSACSGMIGPPEGGTIYTLRPAFAPAPAGGEKVNWSLALMRPDVPGGLDNDHIALIQPDGTMDYYAKATWPDRLPPLVQQALLDGFEASGRIDAVAFEQDALHADYNLFIQVHDCEARYARADGIPQAVVKIGAKLTTAHGRRIIASFATSQAQPASINSAGATAQALTLALSAAVHAIVGWALNAAPPVVPGQSPDGAAAQTSDQAASPGKPAEQLLHDLSRGSGRRRRGPAPP